MAQYETPHWTGPPPRPERDVRSEIAGWFARYAFVFLVLFFVGLVIAALAFLPTLRQDADLAAFDPEVVPGNVSSKEIVPSTVGEEGFTLLNVSTSPSGALIQIDVDSIGVTPLYRSPVDRKVHLLSVVKPGFARIDTVLFADDFDGDTTSLFFVLKPASASTDVASGESTLSGDDGLVQPARPNTTSNPGVEATPNRPTVDEPVADSTPARPTTGSLNVTTDPSGASVSVDGRIVGVTPLRISGVRTGDRRIQLSLDGFNTENSVVFVAPGVRSNVETTLTAASGTLVVLARPYGTIYIDGQLVKLNLDIEYSTTLPAGPHVVQVSHPVLGTLTHTVVLDGDEKRLVFDFNDMDVTSN